MFKFWTQKISQAEKIIVRFLNGPGILAISFRVPTHDFFHFQHNSEPQTGVQNHLEGLHSRSNSARGKPVPNSGSSLSDLERMSSMKGITVLKGRVPNSGVVSLTSTSRTFTDQVTKATNKLEQGFPTKFRQIGVLTQVLLARRVLECRQPSDKPWCCEY